MYAVGWWCGEGPRFGFHGSSPLPQRDPPTLFQEAFFLVSAVVGRFRSTVRALGFDGMLILLLRV